MRKITKRRRNEKRDEEKDMRIISKREPDLKL